MLGCPHLLVEVGPVPGAAEEQDNYSKLARRQCAREGNDYEDEQAGCAQGDHGVFPRSQVLLKQRTSDGAVC